MIYAKVLHECTASQIRRVSAGTATPKFTALTSSSRSTRGAFSAAPASHPRRGKPLAFVSAQPSPSATHASLLNPPAAAAQVSAPIKARR